MGTTDTDNSSTAIAGDPVTDTAALLKMALGLLEIEARDHDEGHVADRKQRKNIAVTLRGFIAKARAALDGEKP